MVDLPPILLPRRMSPARIGILYENSPSLRPSFNNTLAILALLFESYRPDAGVILEAVTVARKISSAAVITPSSYHNGAIHISFENMTAKQSPGKEHYDGPSEPTHRTFMMAESTQLTSNARAFRKYGRVRLPATIAVTLQALSAMAICKRSSEHGYGQLNRKCTYASCLHLWLHTSPEQLTLTSIPIVRQLSPHGLRTNVAYQHHKPTPGMVHSGKYREKIGRRDDANANVD
ncbi:hypothetical protein DERF_009884 [Dermatophagoides farinae]|uniref:Uncharacterized protein n=1 Tax=Dermatophagoides farinae TaxID=6954 RepID=A0A922HYW5_DERFA|nr:hypothetical protein DERF_009884 [Dermatophagoides farinae]